MTRPRWRSIVATIAWVGARSFPIWPARVAIADRAGGTRDRAKTRARAMVGVKSLTVTAAVVVAI